MEHAEAAKDVPEYLANPINAFLVVKRLTLDWKQAEHYMKDHVYQGIELSINARYLFGRLVLECVYVCLSR